MPEWSSAQATQKRFHRENELAQPDNPPRLRDYEWCRWPLTLFLFVTVFVLLCLYFCIGDMSFVSPKSTLRQQFAHNTLADTLAVPGELHLGSPIWSTRVSKPFCHEPHRASVHPRASRCPQVAVCRAGSSRPLVAACHWDTIPPPNVPPWLLLTAKLQYYDFIVESQFS